MTDDLQRGLQRLAPGGDRAQPRAVSAEQEERLRSLGYTAGSGGSGPLDDPSLPDPRTRVELYDRLQAAAVARVRRCARVRRRAANHAARPRQPVRVRHARVDGLPIRQPVDRGARSRARSSSIPIAPAFARTTASSCASWNAMPNQSASCGSRRAQSEDDARTRVSLAETLVAERKDTRGRAARRRGAGEGAGESGGARRERAAARRTGADHEALPYFEKPAAGSDAEALHRAGRAYLAAGDWRRRATPPTRRCGAVPGTHGRWRCSATPGSGRTTRRGHEYLSAPSRSVRDGRSSGRRWPTASTAAHDARAPKSVGGGQPR